MRKKKKNTFARVWVRDKKKKKILSYDEDVLGTGTVLETENRTEGIVKPDYLIDFLLKS